MNSDSSAIVFIWNVVDLFRYIRRAGLFRTDGLSVIQPSTHHRSKPPPKSFTDHVLVSHPNSAPLLIVDISLFYGLCGQIIAAASVTHARMWSCGNKKSAHDVTPIGRNPKAEGKETLMHYVVCIHPQTNSNFTVGNTLIMDTLSSITASQTGNQVAVSTSSFLISSH